MGARKQVGRDVGRLVGRPLAVAGWYCRRAKVRRPSFGEIQVDMQDRAARLRVVARLSWTGLIFSMATSRCVGPA